MAAAATVPFIPVGEYLGSVYRPDVDYLDGVLEERNVGEMDHADVQGELIAILRRNSGEWGIRAYPELRVQTSATRFRVPDVCVVESSRARTPILREAPLLCIEVLSAEDSFRRLLERCRDYLAMGVPEVWIFDPETRAAHVLRPDGTLREHRSGELRLDGSAIVIKLAEVFGALDVS